MPLVLPDQHPFAEPGDAKLPPDGTALRIGIINIMPRMESYEPLLLGPLSRVSLPVEPVFIRLETHSYLSSDQGHLERFYRTFGEALRDGPLDGLILTGAPVEELEYTDVHYWRELTTILDHARSSIPSTLGLCWGGMALGGLLGIKKLLLPRKLFGVFENRTLVEPGAHPLLHGQAGVFPCAHSRHSGIGDAELERAARAGQVRLLAHAPETGYSLFESPDHRFVMHLGHPEYIGERITFEVERDRAAGRTDVEAPQHFDPAHPDTRWHAHREALFESWITLLADSRAAPAAPAAAR